VRPFEVKWRPECIDHLVMRSEELNPGVNTEQMLDVEHPRPEFLPPPPRHAAPVEPGSPETTATSDDEDSLDRSIADRIKTAAVLSDPVVQVAFDSENGWSARSVKN